MLQPAGCWPYTILGFSGHGKLATDIPSRSYVGGKCIMPPRPAMPFPTYPSPSPPAMPFPTYPSPSPPAPCLHPPASLACQLRLAPVHPLLNPKSSFPTPPHPTPSHPTPPHPTLLLPIPHRHTPPHLTPPYPPRPALLRPTPPSPASFCPIQLNADPPKQPRSLGAAAPSSCLCAPAALLPAYT